MRFNPTHDIHNVHHGLSLKESREVLIVTILLALFFLVAAIVVVATRAQNPSCADLKKRLDDTTRAYQTAQLQSQSIEKNYASSQSAVRKLQDELIANDKRKAQAERDIAAAQRDRTRCDQAPALADNCANVTHRVDSAVKRLAYARANENKLYADLSENQQRLAAARAMLRTSGGNLTSAQQDLDEINKALAAAGCGSDDKR